MKKANFSFRRVAGLTMLVALSAVLFTACKKNDAAAVRIPAAGLMVFNLAPDRDAVGVTLSGSLVGNAAMRYNSFNGIYQNIYTGTRDINVYDFYHDSTLAKSSFSFNDSTYYSLFVVGNKGSYQAVVTKDDVASGSPADQSYLRYINAIPDSSAPAVAITASGTQVSNDAAKFAQVSDFKAVPSGDVTIALANGSNISASRTISLEKGKIYTALLTGDPAATDSARNVQIRYIVNGTVDPATAK